MTDHRLGRHQVPERMSWILHVSLYRIQLCETYVEAGLFMLLISCNMLA